MPKHVACGLVFGHPLAIPVPDIDRTDLLLLLGANPLESNGSLATAPDWPGRLEAIRRRGGRVVVVDPRRTRTAEHADLHVPIRPGTDAALLAGIAQRAVRRGPRRSGRLADTSPGSTLVDAAVAGFTPERVASFTGVPAETVRSLARDLAAAPTAVVYGRIGTHTTAYGTLAAWLVDVLNVLTGNLDRPGGAMFPHAAHEQPRRPPRAFRPAAGTAACAGLPEALGELPVATLADEMETPGEGQVRALLTIAGNPALTTPDAGRLDGLLASLELMVCVDPYLNATTRHADVILPPPSVLEKSHYDLAFTALSVRNVANFSPPVFEREPGSPSEFEILVRLAAIAAGLGADADLGVLADATIAGAGERGGRRPGIVDSRPRSRTRSWRRSATGRPRSGSSTSSSAPVIAATRSARARAASRSRCSRRAPRDRLRPARAAPPDALATESGKVELAPPQLIADLARLEQRSRRDRGGRHGARRPPPAADGQLVDAERARARARQGQLRRPDPPGRCRPARARRRRRPRRSARPPASIEVPVELTDGVMPGVVCIPYGWGHGLPGTRQAVATGHAGVNVNVLTDASAIDPISGNAVLNGIPVTVAPA